MPSIFHTSPTLDGYTWSITSKLGAILLDAESKFGCRDRNYNILGVEYTSEDGPQVWYPGSCNDIIIQITENCADDMDRAVFQVAHEVIHCLSPTGGRNSSVLEEGIACHFSVQYTQQNNHGIWLNSIPKYSAAQALFEQLYLIDSEIIRKVRILQPTISSITTDDLLLVNSRIPKEMASALTAKFV